MDKKTNNKVKAIRLASCDNVATLLVDVAKGDKVDVIDENNKFVAELEALQVISMGNKIALTEINKGQEVTKANYSIGVAIELIAIGNLVHVQNVRSTRVDIPEPIIQQIIQQMQIEC